MNLYEVIQPGNFLAEPEETTDRLSALLHLLTSTLVDAAIALDLYEKSLARSRESRSIEMDDGWEERRQEKLAVSRRIRAERIAADPTAEFRFEETMLVDFLADQEIRAGERERGVTPPIAIQREPFLHARSFALALELILKTLIELSKQPGAPAAISDLTAEFKAALPGLIDVRDSIHHVYERVQGKARRAELPTKSISISNLGDGALHYTAADGSESSVPVGHGVAKLAQRIVQSALNAYNWRGYPVLLP